MIVTVTPNPSVDRTVEVEAFVRGVVARARDGRVDPGGKGVNIARALAAHGHETVAVLPTGGWEGEQLAKLLGDEGIRSARVSVAGATRANITVAEPDGTVTKLNEPGPHLSPAEVEALIQTTVDAGDDADWVVAGGSLPPGPADDLYALIVHRLARSRTKVAVDTSGPALLKSLSAGPDVIKPNLEELSDATGIELTTLGNVVDAAHELQDQGAGNVIVSLGSVGALYVGGGEAVHASANATTVRSAVGAGDALLAGFVANGGDTHGFVQGVAWATAAVGLPGSRMPGPSDVDPGVVRIHTHIERGLSLNSLTRKR